MTHPTGFSLAYAVSGLFVGVLVGLTGVGGGSLMTPLLVLLFRFHPATAIGTDLLYAAVTKSVGTFVHGLAGTVAWRVVGLLAAGSLPGTLLTLWGLSRLGPPSPHASHLLTALLGAALLLTAASLFARDWLIRWAERFRPNPTGRVQTVLTVVLGLYLGVFVTLSSVGAGAIGVTALVLLYPTLPLARVVGSDIAHAVPLTLVAGIGHWLIGSVDWTLLGSLVCGSIPGVIAGSILAPRLRERALRPILAAILVVVGVRLLA
ncbi:MAG: sulfite exporter TauE/SafE family protein [Gluconacetobacter diazotrophicus]|nr:sulfite exporter TauE/SafE family protein [Gluconacetobacter diazotrophicus]